MKKNYLIIALVAVIVVAAIVVGFIVLKPKEEKGMTDAVKFKQEYTQVADDNVFTYRSIDEIINILKNGTGIVYLGFPECPWCGRYVVYLNEVAKDKGIDKIYYYNILNDRKNNTDEYLEIVEILKDYLQYDAEGNLRVYVPSVIAVSKGEIVGFDDETAWDTKGFEKPEEYWTNDEVKELKEKLSLMMNVVKNTLCNDCDA